MDTEQEALGVFWAWLESYVMSPHPQIGRRGPVCPFVPGVVKAGGLKVEVDPTLDGTDADALERRIRAALPAFLAIPQKPLAKSLVLLLPGIPAERGGVVDVAQGQLKHDFVRMGLMAGQFHPHSSEPGARNPEFPADRSPIPLLVIRHMAIHDVLFLDRDAEWFGEYRARFASEYARGRVRDPYLRERYAAACERFAVAPAA